MKAKESAKGNCHVVRDESAIGLFDVVFFHVLYTK